MEKLLLLEASGTPLDQWNAQTLPFTPIGWAYSLVDMDIPPSALPIQVANTLRRLIDSGINRVSLVLASAWFSKTSFEAGNPNNDRSWLDIVASGDLAQHGVVFTETLTSTVSDSSSTSTCNN